MSRYSLLALSLFASAGLQAEEALDTDVPTLPSPLKTEVEFGYQSHSGNSDTQSINGRLEGTYTAGRHRHSGQWKYYKLNKDGEEDKHQSSYQLQSDYKLGPKTYLYANFNGIDSKYSAYFRDYTFSGGIGYQFTHTEKFTLELEMGPGYRHQKPNLDELDDDDLIFPNIVDEAIIRSNLSATWQVLPNLTFTGDVSMVGGKSNTRWDTELSATNKVTDRLSLKINHSLQYHDLVPNPELSNSDTVISVNLLYVF